VSSSVDYTFSFSASNDEIMFRHPYTDVIPFTYNFIPCLKAVVPKTVSDYVECEIFSPMLLGIDAS
jgi:hypothetical protein